MNRQRIVLITAIAVLIVVIAIVTMKPNKKFSTNQQSARVVRKPAVAGQFYPKDKEELAEQIEQYINKVKIEDNTPTNKIPHIIIVPHAGYQYSAQVAAFAFKEIQNADFNTVILIGSSHQQLFQGAALPEAAAWLTPLGEVTINSNLIKKLNSENDFIQANDKLHAVEHSLEVEIPFLQQTLPNFTLIPVLLGQTNSSVIRNLAEQLYSITDEHTLTVISSDLSHYPKYQTAQIVDEKTINAILSGNPEEFDLAVSEQMSKNTPNLSTCACGRDAIKIGMLIAQKRGLEEIKLLKYANSGDSSGEKSRVVGYAAIAFYANNIQETESENLQNSQLDNEEKQFLLNLARDTLENYITNQETPNIDEPTDLQKLTENRGAFVTLHKDGELRGCIGQIIPTEEPLWLVVQNMTIAAATQDHRFTPVKPSELSKIKIEISVLTRPKEVSDPKTELSLGKHGVIIQKGVHSGVFLPQVATETGWDLETFLNKLCTQKAGLPKNCWQDQQMGIYKFTAQVFSE